MKMRLCDTTRLQPVVLQFQNYKNENETLRHHQALAGGTLISKLQE
jgi:hypothetical protein